MLFKLLSSGSETNVLLPSGPQWQRFTPPARRRLRKPFSKNLTILLIAVLAILAQGCAIVRTSSTPSAQDDAPTVAPVVREEVALKPEVVDRPGQVPDVIPKSMRAKPAPSQSMPIVTPLSLPRATIPLESTATATRVVVDMPIFTPTSEPTATSLPLATPTPVPVVVMEVPTETPTPEEGIRYVVFISIDGLRPDALALAHTPVLDELIAQGAYCPTAQTIVQSRTLPGHASMLTGVVAEKHGLLDSLPYIGWPGLKVPTLFNVAHDAGLTTGMVLGKEKLNYLVLGDSVDSLFGIDTHDEVVKNKAVEFIRAGLPNILFVHFPDVDAVGHKMGWMSEHQLNAVTYVDGLISEIVVELENCDYWNNTLLIVTADHGGHNHGHGDDSPVDRTIPWLAFGPGVPKGITMGDIYIYDTAATVLYALDVPVPEHWDGRVVMEIFSQAN